MPLFQILTPSNSTNPMQNILLEDRFSWFAFLLPPVWSLSHQLWLETLVWIVVTGTLVLASWLIGDDAAFWLYAIFALWIGFSAADLRSASLARKNYTNHGRLAAPDEFAAEQDWLKRNAAK